MANSECSNQFVRNVMVLKKDTCSVRELINWVNDEMQCDVKELSEMKTGAIYCQFIHKLFPTSISLSKVYLHTNAPYEIEANFKLIRSTFSKLNIRKEVPQRELVKGRGHYEFLNWLHKFHKQNHNGEPYDALGERKDKPIGLRRIIDLDRRIDYSGYLRRSTTIVSSFNTHKQMDLAPRSHSLIGICAKPDKHRNVGLFKNKVTPDKLKAKAKGTGQKTANHAAMDKPVLPEVEAVVGNKVEEEAVRDIDLSHTQPACESDQPNTETFKGKPELRVGVKPKPTQAMSEIEKIKSEPARKESEPVPMRSEAVQKKSEPVPKKSEPVPKKSEPVPKKSEPVPKKSERVPKKTERVPRKSDPIPKKSEPVPRKSEPVPRKSEPVPIKSEPVQMKSEPVPIISEPVPIKAEQINVKQDPVDAKLEPVKIEAGLLIQSKMKPAEKPEPVNLSPSKHVYFKRIQRKENTTPPLNIKPKQGCINLKRIIGTSQQMASEINLVSCEPVHPLELIPVSPVSIKRVHVADALISPQEANLKIVSQQTKPSVFDPYLLLSETAAQQPACEIASQVQDKVNYSPKLFADKPVAPKLFAHSNSAQSSTIDKSKVPASSRSEYETIDSVTASLNAGTSKRVTLSPTLMAKAQKKSHLRPDALNVKSPSIAEIAHVNYKPTVTIIKQNSIKSPLTVQEPVRSSLELPPALKAQLYREPVSLLHKPATPPAIVPGSHKANNRSATPELLAHEAEYFPGSDLSLPIYGSAGVLIVERPILKYERAYSDGCKYVELPSDSDTDDEEDDRIWNMRRQIALLKDKLVTVECILMKYCGNSRVVIKKLKRYLRKQQADEPFVLGNLKK
ncbi:titin-like [Drosophila hydei]|uniref:Titin-like n=1 Tax=Drosophila hydei TaxID=7224 RepID=A0A6J1MQG7_DROHY|nr:titin-like [Drosophila hydei]XP_023179252.2 titin-like [Drosophila hydei]XP_023179253.2 titin-like [Drosophila hydei]